MRSILTALLLAATLAAMLPAQATPSLWRGKCPAPHWCNNPNRIRGCIPCRRNLKAGPQLPATLDPGSFLSMLKDKAEEAGCELILINTRKHKPSQTCPVSWQCRKKSLDERTHVLPDGRVIGRDHASALVMLAVGLRQLGREPAWTRATASETAIQSREAA